MFKNDVKLRYQALISLLMKETVNMDCLTYITMEECNNTFQILTNQGIPTVSPVKTNTEEQKVVKVKYQRDIDALVGAGFKLTPGELLEMDLKEALVLLPRDRRRSDAYNSLILYLDKEFGCRLIITSKKKKSNQKKGKENG